MTKCLECGSEIKQTEGRRPRKFCDNKGKCKGAYWLKNKPKEPRYVLKSTLDSVVAKYEDLLSEFPVNKKAMNSIVNDILVSGTAVMQNFINEHSEVESSRIPPNSEKGLIARQIAEYESEIRTLGDNSLGKRRKLFLEGKIRELKHKL